MIDGKSYIGQTVNDFNRRYDGGKWWKYTGNIHLKRAAEKYGYRNFQVSVLHSNTDSEDELNRLEVFYIKKHKALHPNGYNFDEGGCSRKHCEFIGDKIAMTYRKGIKLKFKNPQGEIFEVLNLSKFCQDNNLSKTMMHYVSKGRYRQHKGWVKPETVLKEMKFKSPTGKIVIVKERELRPFCRKYKLHHGAMGDVWRNKTKQFKGWVKYE